MPPKPTFSKQIVLESAFQVACKHGFRGITARSVAELLGSSTSPVYSFFDSMAELQGQVLAMARDSLMMLVRKKHTESVFLNCGAGVVVFARDYPQLYRALFLESAEHSDIKDELVSTVEDQMVKSPRYAKLPTAARRQLVTTMYTFTHGLASFASVGLLEDSSKERIIQVLNDVGDPITAAAMEGFE